MGFFLDAFLGRTSDLQQWGRRLPSAVVCELSGDLGLVPVTRKLLPELYQGVHRWGVEASERTTVAYVSMGEFGNQSHEEATLWSGGREVLSGVTLREVLDYLRDQAGLNLGNQPIDLEKYRGETAAEQWVAAAHRDRSAGA